MIDAVPRPSQELPPLPRGALGMWLGVSAFALLALFGAALDRADFILLAAGASVALLLSFWGSALALPLYFLATFGGEILVPGLPVSLNRALALLLVMAIGMDAVLVRWRLRTTPALVLLVLFTCFIMAMAILKLPEKGRLYEQPVYYLVISIGVAAASWRESWRARTMWALGIISLLFSFLGLAEYVLGADIHLWGMRPLPRGELRINGIASDAIQYGFFCCWGMAIGLYLMTRAKGPFAGVIALAIAGVQLAAAMLTLNRQVPLILAPMLVAFVYLCRWKHRRALGMSLVLAAALAVPVLGAKIADRFSTATSNVRDPSFAIRYDKALIAWEMMKANPWTGIGHNYFQFLHGQYRPIGETVLMQDEWTQMHTVDMGYIQIAAEYGAIGTTLWIALILALGARLWRARSVARGTGDADMLNFTALLVALMIQLLVSQTLQDTFGVVRTYILMGLIMGTAVWTSARTGGGAEP